MNPDDVETMRECRRCCGKGLMLVVYGGPTGRARQCPDCNGDGWVTFEVYARQKLRWPMKEKNDG